VIVADSRGHGRSTRSDQRYAYALMAADYLALLDHLRIDKVAVGWSDGAIIGLDIAIRHPERPSRLFAFGANYTPEGFKASAVNDQSSTQSSRAPARTTPACHPRLASSTRSWRRSRCGATQPTYTQDQLRAITVPTVIVVCEHDEAIEPAHIAEMAKLAVDLGQALWQGL
jgi:pimeloyl-ACP methyl ester carboxylesterase